METLNNESNKLNGIKKSNTLACYTIKYTNHAETHVRVCKECFTSNPKRQVDENPSHKRDSFRCSCCNFMIEGN